MDQKYTDLHTTQLGFISDVLNQSRPALVIFYAKNEWDTVLPHMGIIEKFKEKVPALPVFLFDIEEEKNLDLTDAFGIEQSPTFVIFKNGNMNRFLEENRKTRLNDKTILKFLGSPALYGVAQEEAKKISASFSTKVSQAAKKEAAKALKNVQEPNVESQKPAAKKSKLAQGKLAQGKLAQGKLAQAVAAQKEKNKGLKITKTSQPAAAKKVSKPAAKKKLK